MFCDKCGIEMIEWSGEDYCPSCDREEIEKTVQYIRNTEQGEGKVYRVVEDGEDG